MTADKQTEDFPVCRTGASFFSLFSALFVQYLCFHTLVITLRNEGNNPTLKWREVKRALVANTG